MSWRTLTFVYSIGRPTRGEGKETRFENAEVPRIRDVVYRQDETCEVTAVLTSYGTASPGILLLTDVSKPHFVNRFLRFRLTGRQCWYLWLIR
jgi:hypothetical protein